MSRKFCIRLFGVNKIYELVKKEGEATVFSASEEKEIKDGFLPQNVMK